MFWAKYRPWFLLLVYVVFFGHTALWHYWGIETVGHLGFGDLFSFMRDGVVTSGTVFTLIVFLHAMAFGGLFCGWLCHWGITQDLGAWMLKKCGIKPRMVQLDSRMIPWIWFIILLGQVGISWYVFGMPGTASFNPSANPVWFMVPRSILLICMTTIVSGLLLVYLFGERAFCRSICTFRLWFSWFERIAPHKIRQVNECTNCRTCSLICPMGISVAEEIQTIGHIKNTECIKCHRCIGACPSKALASGFCKTNYHKVGSAKILPGAISPSVSILQGSLAVIFLIIFGFPVGGNMSLTLAFVTGFVIVRIMKQKSLSLFEVLTAGLIIVGLYYRTDMNDFTSLLKGLTAIIIFVSVAKLIGYSKGTRFAESEARHYRVPAPVLAIVLLVAVILGVREIRASILIAQARAAANAGDIPKYSALLESCADYYADRAGAYYTLGNTQLMTGEYDKAAENFRRSLAADFKPEVAFGMLEKFEETGDENLWLSFLHQIIEDHPHYHGFLLEKIGYFSLRGEFSQAEKVAHRFIELQPEKAEGYIALSGIKMDLNQLNEARQLLDKAYAISPELTAVHMAAFLVFQEKFAAAERYFFEAINHEPQDLGLRIEQGVNFARQRKFEQAITAWNDALKIDPDSVEAQENINMAQAAIYARDAAQQRTE